MDFFARQDQARRHTVRLVLYFILAVALTVLLIYLIVAVIFLRDGASDNLLRLWDPGLFAGVAAATLLVILAGSLIKTAALAGGGGAVARMLGGVLLNSQTDDPDERRLLNVVEEMAIASGTPVPEVYLLPGEGGINAFAAGFQSTQAAIGVTRGCMRLLSRDELQGVIAHEFSHILNGDMRLNIRLMGVVHGLICITVIGRVLLYSSSRHHAYGRYALGARSSGRGNNPLPLLGLGLLVIGGIGVLFARLIKSAVSRQREFLADAAAVQFTRNPDGLAGALKKIGGLTQGSRLQSAHAEEASHLFFGNGLKPSLFQGFSTHPPLIERIQAIDPQFDGTFPAVSDIKPAEPRQPSGRPPAPERPRRQVRPPMLPDLLGMAAAGAAAGSPLSRPPPPPLPARDLVNHVGQPQPNHLDYAVELLAALPSEVNVAVRDPLGAVAMVYGMLLSPDPAMRSDQVEMLRQKVEEGCLAELKRLAPSLASLHHAFRLPAVELAFPALRQLSPPQYERFRSVTRAIIESDRQLDLFEFSLGRMLARHLDGHFHPTRPKGAQYHALKPLLPDLTVLLSALAQVGNVEEARKEAAFAAGLKRLGFGGETTLLPMAECHLGRIEPSLDKLALASPALKKRLLDAALDVVAADGTIRVQEADLLRALADTLDCPMPPLLPEGSDLTN